LNETNAAADIYGSLQRTSIDCTGMWNRPPIFLLVDYYNVGDFNGSVFQVAADANNVRYDRVSCSGTLPTSAAWRTGGGRGARWALAAVVIAMEAAFVI